MAREEMDPLELEAELEMLAKRMERLRVLFEQYFQGIERVPPYSLQKDVVRIFHRLTQLRIRSTTLKFKLQGLVQRFSAHRAYWSRSMREMEEGKHPKQLARNERLRRRQAASDLGVDDTDDVIEMTDAEENAAAEFMAMLGESVRPKPSTSESSDAPVKRSADEIRGVAADDLTERANRLKALRDRLARQGAVPAPPLASAPPEKPPVDTARQVYERLVETKKRLGERVDHLTYENVREGMEKQAARTREKLGCREVEFDVVIKDGKTLLKPIPR